MDLTRAFIYLEEGSVGGSLLYHLCLPSALVSAT
jgi:hypothetical protein